jgi:predicted dithiol-disulfide oxidoreductase (DUF899 family)
MRQNPKEASRWDMPPVVSPREWEGRPRKLLVKEEELSRAGRDGGAAPQDGEDGRRERLLHHTRSTLDRHSRRVEAMGSTWSYLDITALGRHEDWADSPDPYPQTAHYQWWRAQRVEPSRQNGRVIST